MKLSEVLSSAIDLLIATKPIFILIFLRILDLLILLKFKVFALVELLFTNYWKYQIKSDNFPREPIRILHVTITDESGPAQEIIITDFFKYLMKNIPYKTCPWIKKSIEKIFDVPNLDQLRIHYLYNNRYLVACVDIEKEELVIDSTNFANDQTKPQAQTQSQKIELTEIDLKEIAEHIRTSQWT